MRRYTGSWMRFPVGRIAVNAACMLALLLQVLQPVGFMPAEGGRAFLKLCSGADLQPRKAGVHPGDHHSAPCPFAAVGSACAPPSLFLAAPRAADVFFQPVAAPLVRFAPSGPLRAQSPRAPPVENS